ncbi:MAG: nickel-dependent lactate racemase [Planctomycetes bacterium]|nr:nickel-dependent lactate racemase [Planctomycetota bacterium]
MTSRSVDILFGTGRMPLRVPERADVLRGPEIPRAPDPQAMVRQALASPIGCPPLRDVAAAKRPGSVCITMSDITRPVPNELLITAILDELHAVGIADDACTVLIATGMHRPSTERERQLMLGDDLLRRVRVVDHEADRGDTHVRVSDEPKVSVNRIYAEADLKIVTGLIEPHFMAGYSGGRKGICPGLVDLETVQRFHGYRTMGDPAATEGRMQGNPCHEIGMQVAQQVGCDFLVNAAITHERELAGVFAGDLVAAHEAGCAQVGAWTAAEVQAPYDLVVTTAGGYPLDENFYQTVKGMVTALPALHRESRLLMCSACVEVGSPEFTELMMRYGNDHPAFLREIASNGRTTKDQWQFQMQTRVLERIGRERLLLANDGLPVETQQRLGVTPVAGDGDAAARVQRFVDEFAAREPNARIAVIPEGPYTMLRA